MHVRRPGQGRSARWRRRSLPIETNTALIYLRISTNRTSERASIQQQREDCTALAKRLGYASTIEFVDEAISAYQDRARPDYQRLLRRLEKTPAATVVIWHLDRLYRRPDELEGLLDLLDSRPIRIEAVQGGSFDLNRHEGRLFARQLVAFANYESAHRGARVARAQQQRARDGLLHGGSRYGFSTDGVLRQSEANTLRRIVNDYLLGLSSATIAKDLNAEGIPAPKASRWGSTTIQAILTSERLHGWRHDPTRQHQIAGTWERVLTSDESALVRAHLLLPRRTAARSSTTLLGGILRCPRCHGRLVAGVTRLGRKVYACRTATARCPGPTIDAASTEALVEAGVFHCLELPADATLLPPDEIFQSICDAQRELTTLAEAFGRGDVNHESYVQQRQGPTRALESGIRYVTGHTRARILTLVRQEFHQRWTHSMPFRRATVCALLPELGLPEAKPGNCERPELPAAS